MLNGFFYLGDLVIIIFFVTIYFLSAILLFWLCNHSRFSASISSFSGLATTLMGVPTSLFALTSAFLGVAVWQNFQANNEAVSREAQAIVTFINYEESIPSLSQGHLSDLAKFYARSAIEEEWEVIVHEKRPAIGADLALKKLLSKTLEVANMPGLSSPIASELIRSAQNINLARNARLGVINTDPIITRWLCVVLLGLMIQVVAAAIHIGKPRQMALTLGCITTSVLIVLILIALSVDTFSGVISVSKSPLEKILIKN